MDWATLFAGVMAGAAVVTLALKGGDMVRKVREGQRRVKVTLKNGVSVNLPDSDGRAILIVEAANPGRRTVTLAAVGIRAPNDLRLYAIPSHLPLPMELHEGKSCTEWLDLIGAAQRLRDFGCSGKVELIGFYTDAVGTTHDSKPFSLDVDHWADAKWD